MLVTSFKRLNILAINSRLIFKLTSFTSSFSSSTLIDISKHNTLSTFKFSNQTTSLPSCGNRKTTRLLNTFSTNYFSLQIKNMMSTSSTNNIEIKEISIPMPWGSVKGQIMGKQNKHSKPILCLHGYLDNSNSFKPMAPYMCKSGEYYMISIDFPGHGFSSRLPDGIPYTPKLFLATVRRVVNYLDLKNFIFLCHSYGVGISLVYDTVFKNECKAIIGIDWIFSFSSRKWHDIATYWKEGIDELIRHEKEEDEEKAINAKKEPLTMERAVEILLNANKHLDKTAASVLLERAIVKNADNRLEFSRDIRVKKTMSLRDHYVDFKFIVPEIISMLSAPFLIIHADPPSYGEQAGQDTLKLLKSISENSKSQMELQTIKGTHHFHMMIPEETTIRVLKFLDKIKITPSTKL